MLSMDTQLIIRHRVTPYPAEYEYFLVISDLAHPPRPLKKRVTKIKTNAKKKEKKEGGGASTWGRASRVPQKNSMHPGLITESYGSLGNLQEDK